MAFEGLRSRWYARQLGSDADLATFRTLHTASLASPALREGLNPESVSRSLKHLRALLGTAAVAIADTQHLLGYDGLSTHHDDQAHHVAGRAIEAGTTVVAGPADLTCGTEGCLVRHAFASPLVVDDRVAGALVALSDHSSASLLRATEEVASWVSGQLELAELDESRHRLVRAEVRALRAQISPHFVYNSLGAIASFVRTDPDRARDLLLEFADFTRYSFRQHGEFTTLAEELRSVERYLLLEQARFGDRLRVTLQVAPEVLGVSIPFLCLQPLVENAVQHGLEAHAGAGRISIEARDADRECVISVEDNGAGQDPERIRRVLAGEAGDESVGLANVDERLRTTFGDEYGLVVETAPGAGTRVVVRVPKFAPGDRTVTTVPGGLRVLVIDDERPALDEVTFLLESDERIAEVHATDSPTDALRLLHQLEVDAVFLDIQMPGLTGIELAHVLSRFKTPPAAVFVTAHDQHAVDAFELNAVDYVLKPVRAERLAEAVRRVLAAVRPDGPEVTDEQVPVERGGVTRFVPVSRIRYVEAEGDYARLHTAEDTHLVRVPLSQLEQDWAEAGFVRIHRSLLIATAFVEEVRVDGGRCTVVIGDEELQVSRRHTRELRDLLVRNARPGSEPATPAPGSP